MLHWRDCDTQIRTMVYMLLLLSPPAKQRRKSPNPILGNSEVKIVHIFTEISISLNFSLRPKSLRLSCRSNLPDKKFLYLWT
ncbi:hypothetical protein HN51_044068, partial [Arachis hypogaea]